MKGLDAPPPWQEEMQYQAWRMVNALLDTQRGLVSIETALERSPSQELTALQSRFLALEELIELSTQQQKQAPKFRNEILGSLAVLTRELKDFQESYPQLFE